MPRSLLPREHGAYVQLLAPLTGALLAFGAPLPSVLLVVGACLAFVANEPLLVALGHRGRRMHEQEGARAKRLLAVLVPAAAAAGLGGLALSPAARMPALAVSAFAALLVVFAWRRAERSLAGELVAAIALAGASAPVAAAAGAPLQVTLELWAAWAAGYACTVVAVHEVIARHKRRARNSVVRACVLVVTLAIVAAGIVVEPVRIASPLALASAALLVVAPAATHLRTIGFALVGASSISIALVVV